MISSFPRVLGAVVSTTALLLGAGCSQLPTFDTATQNPIIRTIFLKLFF